MNITKTAKIGYVVIILFTIWGIVISLPMVGVLFIAGVFSLGLFCLHEESADRIRRVAEGYMNAKIASLEEATMVSTLKQTIKDMKAELNEVMTLFADATSNADNINAEYEKYIAQSKTWKKNAEEARKAGNEDLAKKALTKKAEIDTQISELKHGVKVSRQSAEQVEKNVLILKKQIVQAERSAGILIARRHAAKVQINAMELKSGTGKANNALAALQAFENLVNQEEAIVQAYNTLEIDDDALTKEFQEFQSTGKVGENEHPTR